MARWEQRRQRRDDIRRRALAPDLACGRCQAIGCGRPTRAATSDGLDERYCRVHYEHDQRHGSPFKGSYEAKHLNAYRQAALLWLVKHEEERWVQHAVKGVRGIYQSAGPHIEAFRLTGLKPSERASAHWARLRAHEVDPRLPVAAWLAVEMAIKDDPQPDWHREFKQVQAAKVVHRMASGSHRVWVQEYSFGSRVEELHTYPRPRGRVLRHIGEDLETACELLVDHHLEQIHSFKRERDALGRFDSSPYPKGWAARRRRGSA